MCITSSICIPSAFLFVRLQRSYFCFYCGACSPCLYYFHLFWVESNIATILDGSCTYGNGVSLEEHVRLRLFRAWKCISDIFTTIFFIFRAVAKGEARIEVARVVRRLSILLFRLRPKASIAYWSGEQNFAFVFILYPVSFIIILLLIFLAAIGNLLPFGWLQLYSLFLVGKCTILLSSLPFSRACSTFYYSSLS